MRKGLKLSSLFAILLVAALVLSACGFGGNKTGSGAGAAQTITFTELQEPPSLDSAKSTDQVSFTILNNTMEGLYRVGKDGNPVLGMAAEDPKVSADKLTYTFKLRDAKWSDGQPVKAQDFEYAWKRALDPKTASEYAYILYAVKGAEAYNTGKGKVEDVGVKAIDDKTLEVKLESPIPYFKDLLGFPTYLPQRKDIVEKYGAKYALEVNNLVFNGPFVLSDWKHNQSFQYKKNNTYWDQANVKLATVNVNIVKDDATSVNLYETKKVDFIFLGSDFIEKYANKPEKFAINDSSVWYLEMNEDKPIFKNKKIRQAINMAIDKKTFADSVLKNGSKPAGSLVPPDIKANEQKKFREISPDNVQFNPTEAKKLWLEGTKEAGVAPDTKIELLTSDDTAKKKDGEFIKDQLRTNLGANIVITPVPFKERLERSKTGRFDMVESGWGADYNDPMTYLDLFQTGSSYNRGKWSNAEYDALIKKSKMNPNFEERIQDLVKAEKIILDDSGVAPLYYRSRPGLMRSYIKDIPFHIIGPEYSLKWGYVQK